MSAIFTKWFPSGFRLINGQTLSNWFNFPQTAYEDTITAHAGGGQANAYQLNSPKSRVTVCASANDSVKLKPSEQWLGGEMVVIADGAQNVAVYPGDANDQIDGAAVATAVVITAGKRAIFYATSSNVISSLAGSKTT